MSAKRHYYLQELGIRPWVLRETKEIVSQPLISNALLKQTVVLMVVAAHAADCYPDLNFRSKVAVLLNKLLAVAELPPQSIYITYLIQSAESSLTISQDSFMKQVETISPQLILALGEEAGQFLTNSTKTMAEMRNTLDTYHGRPLLLTYEPAHLLHHPADKKLTLLDLWRMKQCLREFEHEKI